LRQKPPVLGQKERRCKIPPSGMGGCAGALRKSISKKERKKVRMIVLGLKVTARGSAVTARGFAVRNNMGEGFIVPGKKPRLGE